MRRDVIRKLIVPAVLLLCSICALTSSACVFSRSEGAYMLHAKNDTIVSVEIFDLKDESVYNVKSIPESYTPIAVLPKESFDDFLRLYDEMPMNRKRYVVLPLGAIDPKMMLHDYVVMVAYESGSVEFFDQSTKFYYGAGGREQLRSDNYINGAEWFRFLSNFAEIENRRYVPETTPEPTPEPTPTPFPKPKRYSLCRAGSKTILNRKAAPRFRGTLLLIVFTGTRRNPRGISRPASRANRNWTRAHRRTGAGPRSRSGGRRSARGCHTARRGGR